jgi:uncharacterized membrane protein
MWRFIRENKGKIVGGLAGFLVALLLIVAWPIILMVFLIFLGILLGMMFDMAGKARRWIEETLSRRDSDEK